MRVSAETIYRSLFLQARGVLDKQLITHLRRVHPMRCSRNASTEGQGRGAIIGGDCANNGVSGLARRA